MYVDEIETVAEILNEMDVRRGVRQLHDPQDQDSREHIHNPTVSRCLIGLQQSTGKIGEVVPVLPSSPRYV